MNALIGELLPLAVGIAISPVPIIATILLLLASSAKTSSLGFMAGWVGGIVVALAAFTLLGTAIPDHQEDSDSAVGAVVRIVLGALLLVLAVRQWRARPHGSDAPVLPPWMAAIDTMRPGRAAGLAFLLAAVNPKNLLLAAAAGVAVSAAETVGSQVGASVIFLVSATASVTVPVVAGIAAADRLAPSLNSLRAFLVQNNVAIMAVVLLLLGVSLIGKGVGAL